MLLRTPHCPSRRRGVILLVVLALLTLFAAVGISFVYFSESEATQAANQKQGETIKLPDPDMLFNSVIRQIVYPTDNRSALYTQSLMENLYGSSGFTPNDSEGRLPRFYRDNSAGVRDPHLIAGLTTAAGLIGQDELFRLNKQFQTYNEQVNGALNPTYTYPDHKNPFLGAVAGDWIDKNLNHHGPVAVARSFARELKFRIAIVDTSITDTTQANVIGYQEVVVNPFTPGDYDYWLRSNVNQLTPPGQDFYIKRITLPLVANPYQYVPTPGAPVLVNPGNPALPPPIIQCNADGSNAFVVMDRATCLAHTLRPNPRTNPFFPPPAGPGGDVKNLPPEVKTLVGFDAAGNPIFDDKDSYWMDFGFPAIPWSNNKKIKPLMAAFIMANDGKVNLNTAGNLRGRVDATNGQTFSLSAYGMTPAEINPAKVALSQFPLPVPPAALATVLAEQQQLLAGNAVGGAYPVLRGRNGLSVPDMDPSTMTNGYRPLLRRGPFYSAYNVDGSFDGVNAADYYKAGLPGLMPGQYRATIPADIPFTNYTRFPFYNTATEGFNSGSAFEWARNNATRSPLFTSPFTPDQVAANILSDNAGSTQRTFGLHNLEALYRGSDTGADHLSSDLRRLIPTSFATPQTRWQYSLLSFDLNSVGVAPWHTGGQPNQDAVYNPYGGPPIPPNRDPTPGRVSGPPTLYPWTPPNEATPPPPPAGTNGEFKTGPAPSTPPYWRSIFGNTDRLDLARQLPDYPLPINAAGAIDPTVQLDLTNPVVRAQYYVALRARQRMAMEIYRVLVNIIHPTDAPTNHNAKRYLAQLSVNIVDYIDNDDYPTWMFIPDITATVPANMGDMVWGTELPRLLLNEIYAEASNGSTSATPPTRATGPYNVRHWVELYNPLRADAFAEAWPDGANVRLNITNGTPAGSSVYRLILASSPNLTGIRNDPTNTLGTPNDMSNGGAQKTRVVYFPAANGTNPIRGIVDPSGTNYGTGAADVPPANPNPGFFVVGPTAPPADVAAGIFPVNDYTTDEMQLDAAVPEANTRFPDNARHRGAVLLQRLANPYLPFNPVPGERQSTGEQVSDPTQPYNPYITIDYADNLLLNHAVEHNSSPSGAPDKDPPQNRYSLGKIQPYAGYGFADPTNPTQVISTWTRQYPDARPATRNRREDYTDQPQHTFHRHNGINAVQVNPAPVPPTFPNPDPGQVGGVGVTSGLAVNTLRVPFDWLVHLDRAPVSPAELLEVSGYRPHELTQQFNQFATVPNVTMAPLTYTGRTTVTLTATPRSFMGSLNGVAWAIKPGDMVYLTYTTATGPGAEWALVLTIPNASGPTAYDSITAQVGQTGQPITITGPVTVRAVVPFAHHAPWHLTGAFVNGQSSNRLYRLLEFLAVRNPGVDMGQIRFTSNVRRNLGPVDTVAGSPTAGTRWIQLTGGTTPSQLPFITPNDALLGMTAGDDLNPATSPINQNPVNVGDTLVINAGVTDPTQGLEQRVTVLEVNWQTNQIRVALPYPPPAVGNNAGTVPMTLDYAFHSGRQPGRVNLNDVWDEASFVALADPQALNYYLYNSTPGGDPDSVARGVFRRLVQQRQPGFYSATAALSSRLPGQTNRIILDPSNPVPGNRVTYIPEDRPFQGMAVGDSPGLIPAPPLAPYPPPPVYTVQNAGVLERPTQGIGNTWLSDRYQENNAVPGEQNEEFRLIRTLFEVGPTAEQRIGLDNPYRRNELLSKLWNNSTVRSNTFSVWLTIGYFEYDEVNGLGQELNQSTGKNVRHRFFAVVDRTSIDSWMKAEANFLTPDMVNNAAQPPIRGIQDLNPGNLPALDPCDRTATDLTVYSLPGAYTQIAGNVWQLDIPQAVPNPFVTMITPALPAMPYLARHYGRLVQIESDAGSEVAMLLDPRNNVPAPDPRHIVPPPYPGITALSVPPEPPATYPDDHRLFVRLTLPHAGTITIRPLPIPPAVLYWTQYK